jgi:peptidoglycan/LPS O-acetylase OafA/YrhL
LLAAFRPWRRDPRSSWLVVAAIAGLIGLAGWSLLSALWSPTPDVALANAQRILLYALSFVIGLWLCDLLRGRRHLSMAPLALAGAVAGAVTAIALLSTSHPSEFLTQDGTLDYPLGYRNANAAFFAVAL